MIDNQSATLCSHAQWGIRLGANYNQVTMNKTSNFSNNKSVGIVYSYGVNVLKNNQFKNNTQNIFHAVDNQKYSTLILSKE